MEEYLKKYVTENIEEAIERYKNGEPVQYIIGDVNFYGNTIKVNKDVLIPRYETEELVEKTIKKIKNKFNKKIDVLDLCTGSGCIAITIKKEINSNVTATDISSDALEVAKKNVNLNNVDIKLINSDLFNNIDGKFDCIISNPPYISYDEEIDEIVKNNEPNIALYAPNNGLYFYEEILKNIKKYLNNEFIIAFEIGYKQGEFLVELANKYLNNVTISVEKDLQGRDRFLFIENM